jgi:putative transposase
MPTRGGKLMIIKPSDEWAVQRARYTTLEIITSMTDDPAVSLPAVAA